MGVSIKGFIPVSMLDWDGLLVSTLFTGGCNFRCPYCHNPDLVKDKINKGIDFSIIEEHLINKSGWLDGVVITGGEPLLQPDLKDLLIKIKSFNYKVKLDTNGSLPGVLNGLLEKKLVDYVAMDIKTSFGKYTQVSKLNAHQNIKQSIQLLADAGIDHEFRTTVVPGYVDKSDVLDIASYLKGGKTYFLQQFSSQRTLEPQAINIKKYDDNVILEMAKECSRYLPTKVRGVEQRLMMAQAV